MNEDLKEIFAMRLIQARKMRRLSLNDLAKKLKGKISHYALLKYEAGVKMPDSADLMVFADALGKDLDFFFRKPKCKIKWNENQTK